MASWRAGAAIFVAVILVNLVEPQRDGICPPILDIAILLDTSGGLDSVFEQQINWTVGMIKELPIHDEAVRVSLILYAEEAQTEFNLSRYSERSDIIAHLEDMRLPTGDTKTGNALQKAETELFDYKSGARYNSNRIIVIFTDGLSMDNPVKAAKTLRKRGVKMFSISVNSIGFVPEMLGIVGDAENIFGPMDKERLQERLLDEVEKSRSCHVQPKKNEKTTSAFFAKPTEAPSNDHLFETTTAERKHIELKSYFSKNKDVNTGTKDVIVADTLNELSKSTTKTLPGTETGNRLQKIQREADQTLGSRDDKNGSSIIGNTSEKNKNFKAEKTHETVVETPLKTEPKNTGPLHRLERFGNHSKLELSSNTQLGALVENEIVASSNSVENKTLTATTPCISPLVTSPGTIPPNTTPAATRTSTVSASFLTVEFSTSPLPRATETTTSASYSTTTAPRRRTPTIVASTTVSLPSFTTVTTSATSSIPQTQEILIPQTQEIPTTRILSTRNHSSRLVSSSEPTTPVARDSLSTRHVFQRFTASHTTTTETPAKSTSTSTAIPKTQKSISTRQWTPTRGPNTLAQATTVFPTLLNMEKSVTLLLQKFSELKQRKKVRRIIKRRRNILNGNEHEKTTVGAAKEIRQSTVAVTPYRKFSRSSPQPIVTEEETEIVKNVVQCPMDILFVVDSSGSIAQNYEAQKEFLTLLIKKVEPSRGHRVGLIQFAGPHLQKMEWSFDAHSNNSQLLSAIRSVRHLTGTTYIGAALELSLILLDSRRKHTETTVLLVSDGFSQDDSTQQAKLLRQLPNVKMYAISLNSLTNTQYLTDIVGDRENLFVNEERKWFEEFFTKKLRCIPSSK